ncbi:hypothetical protein E4U41_006304 [Claviceps citrina]|nr:hypothetical protein E4U41_006304 [Claviceps citrina]
MRLVTSLALLAGAALALPSTIPASTTNSDEKGVGDGDFDSWFGGSSCPRVHIFGARGTGIPPGYDLLLPLVQRLKLTHPGATSEAIEYPACGGGAACGGISYGDSARAGTAAVAKAVNDFHEKCPETKFVLMGYSQGGHIIDNALCGGEDPNAKIPAGTVAPISSSAAEMIVAATFMGTPRFQAGLSYEVGTCKAHGFDARPTGFTCASAAKIQSYCDEGDPYCCMGKMPLVHGSYVTTYGADALAFINSKLDG